MTANNAKLDQRETPPQNNAALQQPQESLELAASGPDQKNWRGIGIALLVIVVVCALIVAAIVLLTPGDKGSNVNKSRISLEEVVKGQFSYRRFNGTWISDHEFVFQDAYGAIGIYDATNNSEQVIMSNTTFRQYSISQYSLSADRQYLLLSHKYERIFRHTYKAAFLLYNITNDYLAPLFPKTPELILQYAAWGPTGNQLVYVLDNDVYYMSDVNAKPRQLTKTGIDGIIFNGIPDWVYEEEILSSSNAIWWSKDGKKLSFASFNDTDVDILQYPHYGSYSDVNNVYPELMSLRYPKAGKTNPNFTIWVADLTATKDLTKVQPPKEYNNMEFYFTEVQWAGNDVLSVVWLKRAQNSSIVSLCHENDSWMCKKNYQEDSHGHGWVDLHIAEVDVKTGSKTFLTSGKFDTAYILAHDESKHILYYITTLEGKPGPGIPRVEIRLTATNKIVSVLDANTELQEFVERKAMPVIKNLHVPIDGNYFANVRLYLPPVLKDYEITKYPVLVEVYGGPGTQMVTEKFTVNWGSYLASKKNVVYVNIDGRGSGYQGDKILHELYRQLGTVEVFDQISVASYLKEHLTYIDGKRMAIFGWSYGGFASASALADEETVFNCAISVAPVTSWLYYDSVYTERYMQSPSPKDNFVNYEKSDVMNKASNFKGKKYLLVHGTADDNVHWQQSMMLAKALTDAGVIYRMQVYPDENHGLGHVKLHLYQTMDDFLNHCYNENLKEDSSVLQSASSDSDR
ncbi:Prolyl endopeptidase FAP like protein [Argiope bruennichi]|uniref:Venom dipeptidyl peptidase 4 n=1 Tax=Argiope bruennichi TaxID=94029 RepID=A0A8T0FV86_ARGBR|nr:Prolyl endopeptidase FAP like protein [Argiope bruennichi]